MFSEIKIEEMTLIEQIVNRAESELGYSDKVGLMMDLAYVHTKCFELNFADLVKADKENFAHDIQGIYKHWNRKDMRMDGGFLPRYVKSE